MNCRKCESCSHKVGWSSKTHHAVRKASGETADVQKV